MKISPRIWVPVSLALLLCIGAGVFLLWHIKLSVGLIEKSTNIIRTTSSRVVDSMRTIPTPNDNLTLDAQALTLLREGEALMLQGEIQQAEDKFEGSVQAGGGAPALRKLLESQLQRRNYDGADDTLQKLEKAGAKREDVALFTGLIALHQNQKEDAKAAFDSISGTPEGAYGSALLAVIAGNHDEAKKLPSGGTLHRVTC
jgi:lipopolysaccharide biosynthesis regulator YciM